MNRRSFLKAMAGAAAAPFVVPELIIPERRVFALDRTMLNLPPSRTPGDDTAWLQWHLDNMVQVPTDTYIVNRPLVFRGHHHKYLIPFAESCRIHSTASEVMRIEDCSYTVFNMNFAYLTSTRTKKDAAVTVLPASTFGDPTLRLGA